MRKTEGELRAGGADADAERQKRLGKIIADYVSAVESGSAPPPDEYIHRHADVAEGLRSFFATHSMARDSDGKSPPAACPQEHRSEQQTIPPSTSSPHPAVGGTDKGAMKPATIPAAQAGSTLRCFGDYQLVEEVARGGMGVVYRARQISLNRTVALKTILAGQFACDDDVRRFRTEAEAAANLDHAGIVPIYEVGEFEGQHYFSMGYVDGPSLAHEVSGGPMSPRKAAQLTKEVSEAVAFAHLNDVVHRDLKPANVLIDTDGHPRITDFGLAKRVSGDSDLTATGQVLGTPSYMPPEQAAGKIDQVGPKSDVYSIGAILYELLTARPPFRQSNPIDTLIQVLDSEPEPPRLVNAQVPRDLETICLKCLEKDPAHRYPSAQDLADDLDRYLQGDLIHASSVNLLDRASRALIHSHHEEHFQGWGTALVVLGVIIFIAHSAIHLLSVSGMGSLVTYWMPRAAMFVAIFALLWYVRPRTILPTSSTERPIWAVWIGYLIALGILNLVLAMRGYGDSELYALSAVLSGFGFFVMGSHVWGGSYVVGCVFWIAAPLLARSTGYSSLLFGMLWGGTLLLLGIRYGRNSGTQQVEGVNE